MGATALFGVELAVLALVRCRPVVVDVRRLWGRRGGVVMVGAGPDGKEDTGVRTIGLSFMQKRQLVRRTDCVSGVSICVMTAVQSDGVACA